MKKKLLLLLCIASIIGSCEKDDFCIEPITPNLVIRFYDASNTSTTKSVDDLYVWPQGRDSVVVGSTTDSIAIPLDVTANQTIYNLSTGTLQEQIIIDYDINEVFVSRSCGFKATFSNVTFTANNAWINSILPNTAITIEDETAAHIQIFH